MSVELLKVETDAARTSLRLRRGSGGVTLIFVHGNLSSSGWWAPVLEELPYDMTGVALDLTGFGDSERKPVDARRGLSQYAAQVSALVATLGLGSVHVVGWSMGGTVALQYALSAPGKVRSLTLINPMSPYGYCGSRGAQGTPCWQDGAGSGAGLISDAFVEGLSAKDASMTSSHSPRAVVRRLFLAPSSTLAASLEDDLIREMLKTAIGPDAYPGDVRRSEHWPYKAPGLRGVNNAVAVRHCDVSAFASVPARPPVLWVRGTDDRIVADASPLDTGERGRAGELPGWPGPEVFPPQPMVAQMRSLLERYREAGGCYREVALRGCGHALQVEKPRLVVALLRRFVPAMQSVRSYSVEC